ncbi:MAG TPA: hypothetical protein VF679_07325 [Pedobacter sp.]
MKKLIILFLIATGCFTISVAQPQPAKDMAHKIANKMKDSLSLSQAQAEKIYKINMELFKQKDKVRKEFKGSDQLTAQIQKIENTRDPLYQPILKDKYAKYKEAKTKLISNN